MFKKRSHFHRLQQKRYLKGAYRNPYFQAQKKDSKKIIFSIVGGCILSLFLIIYLYSYPSFALQNVEIRGLEHSSQERMETEIRSYLNESHLIFFHNTNRFLFSKKKFQEHISKTFAFDHFTIHINKNIVLLTIKERTSDIIWKTNGESYVTDLKGVVTQKIESQVTMRPLPIFSDRDNKAIAIGDRVLSENQINHILSFQKLLSAQGISIKETQIDLATGKWTGIVTTQGYTILFDPEGDLNMQADRLKTILRDTLKDTSHLKYIDLRFGDHVYYK